MHCRTLGRAVWDGRVSDACGLATDEDGDAQFHGVGSTAVGIDDCGR